MTERIFIPIGSPRKKKRGKKRDDLVKEAEQFLSEAISDKDLYAWVEKAVEEISWGKIGYNVSIEQSRTRPDRGVVVRVRPKPREFNEILDQIIEYISTWVSEADDLTASYEGGTTYLIYRM